MVFRGFVILDKGVGRVIVGSKMALGFWSTRLEHFFYWTCSLEEPL